MGMMRAHRNVNALGTHFLDPIKEDVGIVEHLGDNKGGACIDLFPSNGQ